MGTFWLKVAVIMILIIAGVIIILTFLPSESEKTPQPPKTFYDVIEEDDERLRAVPKISQPQPPEAQTEQNKETMQQFKELLPEQEAHAQQLFEWALSQRKMGRLPGMTYKKMVDTCREIIELYPDSEYAYKAKRMLGDIPEQYRKQYNITDGEIVIEE